MNSAILTILMLVVSNVFMTLAWYGHLRLGELGITKNWPLYAVILFSWGNRPCRVCVSGACQPHRLCRKWRTVLVGSVEGDAGGNNAGCVYGCRHIRVSRAVDTMESYRGIPASCRSCVFFIPRHV